MNKIKTFNLIAKQAMFFVAAISLFIPTAFSAEQQNLVKNSSFEKDKVGEFPADYTPYIGTVGAILEVDNGGYNGSLKSAKISGAANEAAYLYVINVLPGEKYKVESFCKQIGDGTASMQIFWKTGDKWSLYDAKTYLGDGDWKKAVIDVMVPDATVTTTLTLRLHVEKQTSGTTWFDNVSIQKN
jgi:hypothetical protein